MKRMIVAGQRSPKKQNVYKVCEAMGWNMPTYTDAGTYGYSCKWGGRSQRERARENIARLARLQQVGIAEDISDYDAYMMPGLVFTSKYSDQFHDAAKKFVEQGVELKSYNDLLRSDEIKERAENVLAETLDRIKKASGIQCKFGPTGKLMIPYAN